MSSARSALELVILTVIQEVALGSDEQLLGDVVHSGLVLGHSKNVAADDAVRPGLR